MGGKVRERSETLHLLRRMNESVAAWGNSKYFTNEKKVH